jgi:hypothetical protein
MWIMMLVLVTLSTGEEKTVYIHEEPTQYGTEAECMASFDRMPVLWGGYEMKVKCIQLGMDG